MSASKIVPPFPLVSKGHSEDQGLLLLPESTVEPPDTFYLRTGKRWFDLFAGSLLLVLFAAPMLLVAAAIRLTSLGPVFFVQERVGLHLSTFRCLKFRTMVPDAEVILLQNPQLLDAMAVSWKIPDDPRVTLIGRALRQTSMDELPQLVNVLTGKMSLVGPRPYMQNELHQEFGVHAFGITTVRPGMTGLWQVSGRSHLPPTDRIALDERYIAEMKFSSDFKLLLKTVRVVCGRDGAY